jgi:predicted phosphodiesterase
MIPRVILATSLALAACTDADPDAQQSGTSGDTSSSGAATTSTTASATTTSSSTTASPESVDDSSGSSSSGSTTDAIPEGATPENLRVAFFGDHGLGSDSIATLQLVRDEGAEFLVILGDFDYDDDPTAWHEQLDLGLGPDFPMFAVAGNHDEDAWDGYREVLMDRAPVVDVDCEGEIGIQMSCEYHGLDMVLSGVGTMDPPGDVSHEDFIAQSLAESESIWKVCAWHKNQHDMQVGDKGDEVGWEAYQNCQAGGAIIATGHEHTYERTYTLTDLGNHDGGHGAIGEPEVMQVGPGSTFVFVAGLGGVGIRDFEPDHADDTWWATYYTSNLYVQNGDPIEDFTVEIGVLFIDFHVDGDPYKARGYFKNLAGEMIDEFEIYAAR